MTESEYREFVTTVADMIHVNDLERLFADSPRDRVAA